MTQRITMETTLREVRDNKLLSGRVCNDLLRYGNCETVGDLLGLYNEYKLTTVRDLGPKARGLIKEFLSNNGFLKDDEEENTSNINSKVAEYSVTSNGMSAKIFIDGEVDSTFLDLVKLTLSQALDNEKEKLKFKEFEANPLATKLEDVRPKLSIRSFNCLYRHGCKTVGDVLKMSKEDLDKVRNLGLKGKEEVIEAFSKYGKFKSED